MNVLFVNSAPARCSIHESGAMVAGCLRDSANYNFIYATIDELDRADLEKGRFAWRPGLNRAALPHVDVSVFNWHIVTMPLPDSVIATLPGLKLSIVLEAAPGDPLALTPVRSFDGYIVLDPTLPSSEKVFGFPRPLNPLAFTKRTRANPRPRIGSFGLPTPGKGFELVMEAVNREFEEADVRINVPRGDYIATDVIHGEDYVEHLRRTVTAIAKPGVNVEFTSHYFAPAELVEWCDGNDLNCFMYTREQPGLSATTDQAIISGRPLITIANPTFRHIAEYIPPYPYQSLKDAIASSPAAVREMQWAWSPQVFRRRFEELLEQLSRTGAGTGLRSHDEQDFARPLVLVAEPGQPYSTNIALYRVRVAAALDRSGHYQAQVAQAASLTALIAELLRRRPETVLLLGGAGTSAAEWAQIIRGLLPRIRVVEGSWEASPQDANAFPLQPIIPLHTTTTPLSADPAILLLGFSRDKAALSRALRTIARDDPAARVLVAAEPSEQAPLLTFISALTGRAAANVPVESVSAPPATNSANPYLRANTLAELLSWDDVDFVRCAYVTMLGRQPDPAGEIYYTKRIRTGRSKMEVLRQLRRSTEGQKHDPGIAGLDRALKIAAWVRRLLIGRLTWGHNGGDESNGERVQRNLMEQIRALRAQLAAARKAELPSLEIEVMTLPGDGTGIIDFMAAQRAVIAQDDPRAHEQIRDLLSLAYVTERQILISADRPIRPFSELTASLGEVSLLDGDRLGSALRVGTVLDFGEWAFASRFHQFLREEQAGVTTEEVAGGRALQDLALAGLYDLPSAGFVHAASIHVLGEVPASAQVSEGEALLLGGASRGSVLLQLEMRAAACATAGVGPVMARRFLAELATLAEFDDSEFIARAYDWILERKPDPVEFRNDLDRLSQGGDRIASLAGMLGSDERRAIGDLETGMPEKLFKRDFGAGRAAISWVESLLQLSAKDFRPEIKALCAELNLRPPRTANRNGAIEKLRALFDLALSGAKARERKVSASVAIERDRSIRLFQAALCGLLDLDDREYVGVLFQTVMERDPDLDGFSHYINRLRTGESRASVLADLLGSAERDRPRGASPDVVRFPLLMGLNPALHLAIAWIEGLMAASRSSFVKEVERISSLGGTGTPTLTTDNPADRVEVLFALATDSRSLAVADDIAAARVRLWKARSSIISANYIGVIHAPPPLPDLAAVAIDEELNRRDESSLDVLSRWFGQQETRGGARNIFGEEPPSRLMSGIRPGMAPPACVYFLRGEGEASAAIASMLERQWPTGLLPLTPIEWNSNTRQLEVRSTAAADGIRIGDGPPACLLIAGPLGDDEPLGLVGAISEARSRGWTVLAIVDSSSTAVTLQSPHDPQATRIALYWQSLVLADRVIATSNVAERQLREFLASEVGDDDASLVTTIPFLPGLGAQREVQEAAFAHQLATAVSTLGRGPDEFVGTIFYHSGMAAAALRGPPLAGLLSSLGVSVREMSKVSPVVPFPSSERPSWVIADFETDVSELRKLRSTAARLAAKTAYLGPVPVARRGLMEELLNWDLVATSRFEDFTAVSEYLKTTRLRVVDAESRFVFLDHPSEQSAGALQDGSTGAKPSGASFTVGVTLQSNPEGQTRLQKEFRSDSRERGTKSNPSVHAVDLSDLDKTDSQADLDKLIDEAAQLDLLIVDGTAGHVLDIVERVTARGTPCLVDSALTLPRLQGVLQVPFDRVENILSFVAANVDFFRAELRTAVAMRRGPGASERAGRLLELLATQSAPCVAAAGEKHSQFINQCPGQPLLSLCISTYNRAGWVAMNLDNIFRQIADLDHNIEILLVDNCSTDNTEEVASRFMSHRRFRYVRNTRNVGMLGNLSVTAQLSRGKFVWIIGDDDFTRPGTVARLCDLLENQSKYDLVCFNYGYVSYKDPSEVEDATGVTENFNQLEPPGPDRSGLVGELAPMSENFYTAIYSHVYRRRYAIRAYCQNTLGRPFSSLLTCVPTSAFTLSQMGHLNAYWFGEPALVINSNVSWQQYGTLFDLEQLPRVWDLAERAGAASTEVDRRRSNRLWLVEMMWRDMYANNDVGNQGFFDPERVLMRIKHLNATDELVPRLREIYEDAHRRNEPAARKPANQIFVAWGPEFGSASEAKAS